MLELVVLNDLGTDSLPLDVHQCLTHHQRLTAAAAYQAAHVLWLSYESLAVLKRFQRPESAVSAAWDASLGWMPVGVDLSGRYCLLKPAAGALRCGKGLYGLIIMGFFFEVAAGRKKTTWTAMMDSRLSEFRRAKMTMNRSQQMWLTVVLTQNVPFLIEKLVAYYLRSAVFVHNKRLRSFLHYYRTVLLHIRIHLESFLLQVFNHRNVSLFEVSDAQFENLHLSSDFLKKSCLSEQGVADPISTAWKHGSEESEDAVSVLSLMYFEQFLVQFPRYQVQQQVKMQVQFPGGVAVFLADEHLRPIFSLHVRRFARKHERLNAENFSFGLRSRQLVYVNV